MISVKGKKLKGKKMPHAYEKMRDKFIKDGLSDAEAKEKAARIYNSRLKDNQKPVGRQNEQTILDFLKGILS